MPTPANAALPAAPARAAADQVQEEGHTQDQTQELGRRRSLSASSRGRASLLESPLLQPADQPRAPAPDAATPSTRRRSGASAAPSTLPYASRSRRSSARHTGLPRPASPQPAAEPAAEDVSDAASMGLLDDSGFLGGLVIGRSHVASSPASSSSSDSHPAQAPADSAPAAEGAAAEAGDAPRISILDGSPARRYPPRPAADTAASPADAADAVSIRSLRSPARPPAAHAARARPRGPTPTPAPRRAWRWAWTRTSPTTGPAQPPRPPTQPLPLLPPLRSRPSSSRSTPPPKRDCDPGAP
jgi:hypothetical protein